MAVVRRRPNFAAAPYELVDDETISGQAKTVYVILDRFANYDSGATFVGKDRIARLCGYAKADSVDRYLNELRDKGWISWSRRWKKDTGRKGADGRIVYEYSYSSGKGFEPTTSLYIVNDRVEAPKLSGEGIPPTAGIGVPPTAGRPIPPTAGTNENHLNENQGKGVFAEVEVTGAETTPLPLEPSSDAPSPAGAGTPTPSLEDLARVHAQATPDTWCTADDPRCRDHAQLSRDEVPACRQCGNVRAWFEERERAVVDAKRQAVEGCGFCDDRGLVEVEDSQGRPVAALCAHQGPPQPVSGPVPHREVSSASTRRRALEVARGRRSA